MIKRLISLIVIVLFAVVFFQLITHWSVKDQLDGAGRQYVQEEADDLGAMNIVTAIVVSYRGLDTLGEITVLFLAATGIALLLRKNDKEKTGKIVRRSASEFVQTGVRFLVPILMMVGVYIFLNGHLSPGGGFQGGAVIASAVLLLFLADPNKKLNHHILDFIESFSGFAYILTGLAGLFVAGSFLDSRILPAGTFGSILSAGTIPLIYTWIGLKVGSELAGILYHLKGYE